MFCFGCQIDFLLLLLVDLNVPIISLVFYLKLSQLLLFMPPSPRSPGLHTFLSKNSFWLQWQKGIWASNFLKWQKVKICKLMAWLVEVVIHPRVKVPCALYTCFYTALWRPLFPHIGLIFFDIIQPNEKRWHWRCHNLFIQPVYRAQRACALRAPGLLLADSALTVGRGKTFWRVGQLFFTKTAITRKRKVVKLFSRWESC